MFGPSSRAFESATSPKKILVPLHTYATLRRMEQDPVSIYIVKYNVIALYAVTLQNPLNWEGTDRYHNLIGFCDLDNQN